MLFSSPKKIKQIEAECKRISHENKEQREQNKTLEENQAPWTECLRGRILAAEQRIFLETAKIIALKNA